MTGILSKEQVDNLTYTQCKTALKLLNKSHRMDTPWHELSQEEWNLCDDVANTLLWLEDRIRLFDDPRIPSMDPASDIVKPPEPPVKKSGPIARRFGIGDVIYDDIHAAVRKTGVKLNTLRNYVGRKPHIYQYLD